MPKRTLATAMLALSIAAATPVPMHRNVLGASASPKNEVEFKLALKTITAFDQKEIKEYETIPFETEYVDNPEVEYGTEEVLEPGVNGQIEYTYLLTHWQEEIIDKELIDTVTKEPSTEVISKGTKIVYKTYETPDVGGIRYWYKLRVWATKYDANCIGCTGRTFSGTEVVKGVCATDPNVIPLGTNFYVDGYGLCRAEDIGGAIKGNDVDLGFKDASKSTWGAAYTDVYLITGAPDGSSPY